MAESVASHRYYCHRCAEEINPNEDFTCPMCQSGFIEEVNERFEEEQFNDTVASSMNTVLSRLVPILTSTRHRDGLENSRDSDDEDPVGQSAGSSNGGTPGIDGQGPQYEQLMNGPAGLDTLVQQLISSLIGNAPGIGTTGFLPGDYVIGQSAFDNIVTQLMNQLEPAGPAPATSDQIKSLDTVTVSQEQVDEKIQCSVCFDEYKLAEKVNKLPCFHIFHPDCIKPWLERHGTCPICRKTLSGEDTSTLTDAGRSTETLQGGSMGNLPPRTHRH